MDEISNSLPKTSPDKISFKIAPKITGITIKKENFALSLLLFPKNKDVDYLSIDIEGGEEDLIKSIDYSFYDIKVISIENNYPNDINYLEFLSSKGFKFFNCYGHDEIYYNKNHF